MEKNTYEVKNFTLSVEKLPDTTLSILHIKKGKQEANIVVNETETLTLTRLFDIPVMPPVIEFF